MSTMSNVQLWQYVVIAGPAALVGGAVVWLLCREAMRAMEAMALAEHRGDTPSNLCNPAVERPRPASARAVPELNRGVSGQAELISNGPMYWGDDYSGCWVPDMAPKSVGPVIEIKTDKPFSSTEVAEMISAALKAPRKTGGPL